MRSRTPAVKALTTDALHCESSLNPQGSRVAVTEERESAIRLLILSRVELASSMKYLLSSEPLGRWLSSFIFCKESTILLRWDCTAYKWFLFRDDGKLLLLQLLHCLIDLGSWQIGIVSYFAYR